MNQGSEKIKVIHIITRLDVGGSSTNTIETVARLDPARYDVLLISGRTQDIQGIIGRWAARWAKVPVIIHTPHGHVFYGYFNPIVTRIFIWIERAAARFTDRIITLTERGRREHVEFGVGPLDKFVAIPSGIDIDPKRVPEDEVRQLRGEWIIPSERFIFGTVARLDPIKGLPYLVRAMADVVKANKYSQLLIVGDGSQKQELQSLCERLGVTYNVTFTGHQNDVGRFMEMMDVFVLPSLNEGMGRVLLDAMALSKPVIATLVGGVPDVVDDGKTGLLVKARDPQALAQAMLRLRNDPSLALEMGRNGHKKVIEGYSLELMVQKITALYEACLAQKTL